MLVRDSYRSRTDYDEATGEFLRELLVCQVQEVDGQIIGLLGDSYVHHANTVLCVQLARAAALGPKNAVQYVHDEEGLVIGRCYVIELLDGTDELSVDSIVPIDAGVIVPAGLWEEDHHG